MTDAFIPPKQLMVAERQRIYGRAEAQEWDLPPVAEQDVLAWLRTIPSGSGEEGMRAAMERYLGATESLSERLIRKIRGPGAVRFMKPRTPLAGDLARLVPLLAHAQDLAPARWLQASMTTFGRSVASFLPGHFEAYARVFHPFLDTRGAVRGVRTWRDLAAEAHTDLLSERDVHDKLHDLIPGGAHADRASIPSGLVGPFLEHLKPATTTPEQCWFALWEGVGGCVVPYDLEAKLDLPGRRYHLFCGPIEAAHSTFGDVWFHDQTANLWWPEDHAWCVASEVDFHWTYVGASRSCVQSLLADSRFEAIETTAAAFA